MNRFNECIAHENDEVCKAYWNYCLNKVMTIVLDDEDKFRGVVGVKEYQNALLQGVGGEVNV